MKENIEKVLKDVKKVMEVCPFMLPIRECIFIDENALNSVLNFLNHPCVFIEKLLGEKDIEVGQQKVESKVKEVKQKEEKKIEVQKKEKKAKEEEEETIW